MLRSAVRLLRGARVGAGGTGLRRRLPSGGRLGRRGRLGLTGARGGLRRHGGSRRRRRDDIPVGRFCGTFARCVSHGVLLLDKRSHCAAACCAFLMGPLGLVYASSLNRMRDIPGAWRRTAAGAGLIGADGIARPTIFAEMSALAVQTGALNLGQGFPDEDGPAEVLEAARDGDRARCEPVPAGSRHPGSARGDRGAPEPLLRRVARSGARGPRDGGSD